MEPLEIPITVFVAQAVLPGLFHLEINNSACSPFSIDYQGEGIDFDVYLSVYL